MEVKVFIMEILKQEVAASLLKLPDTANFDEIQSELDKIRQNFDTAAHNETMMTKQISCYDLAKEYIGCIEGPEDLSTNKAYLKAW